MAERERVVSEERPFTAFNFKIEISVPDVSEEICNAAFSDCDGLEMTMQPKTLRQGGDNTRQIHLNGPVSYGQLTLKRGMTTSFHLWEWFEKAHQGRGVGLRANAEVIMLAADGNSEQIKFNLIRCVPIKLRAPTLSAKDGLLAIEELQLAYERLSFAKPEE